MVGTMPASLSFNDSCERPSSVRAPACRRNVTASCRRASSMCTIKAVSATASRHEAEDEIGRQHTPPAEIEHAGDRRRQFRHDPRGGE